MFSYSWYFLTYLITIKPVSGIRSILHCRTDSISTRSNFLFCQASSQPYFLEYFLSFQPPRSCQISFAEAYDFNLIFMERIFTSICLKIFSISSLNLLPSSCSFCTAITINLVNFFLCSSLSCLICSTFLNPKH